TRAGRAAIRGYRRSQRRDTAHRARTVVVAGNRRTSRQNGRRNKALTSVKIRSRPGRGLELALVGPIELCVAESVYSVMANTTRTEMNLRHALKASILAAAFAALPLSASFAADDPVPPTKDVEIPFANHGGIRDWQADRDRGVWIQDVHNKWF